MSCGGVNGFVFLRYNFYLRDPVTFGMESLRKRSSVLILLVATVSTPPYSLEPNQMTGISAPDPDPSCLTSDQHLLNQFSTGFNFKHEAREKFSKR